MADSNDSGKGGIVDSLKRRTDQITASYSNEPEGDYKLFRTTEDDEDSHYEKIDLESLNIMYQRNPIAWRGINKWSRDPLDKGFTLMDGEEVWGEAMDLLKRLDSKHNLMEVLKFAELHGAAGLAMGLRQTGNHEISDPVEPETVQDIEFLNIITLDDLDGGDDLEDIRDDGFEINHEVGDDDYGEIEYLVIEENEARVSDNRRIHKDRFIWFRPFYVENDPTGISMLAPVFNSLVVVDNVIYGSGQSYFYSGTGFPVLETKNLPDDKELDDVRDNFLKNVPNKPGMVYDQDQFDFSFKGAEGKALDPRKYFEPMFTILGGALGGSKQVFFGSEAGEVTGSEINMEQYFGDVSSFQSNKIEPLVRDLIGRLVEWDLLEEPADGYDVRWEDMFEKSDQTKAEIADKKSKAFSRFKKAGLTNREAAVLSDIDPEVIENPEETGVASSNEDPTDTRDPEDEMDSESGSPFLKTITKSPGLDYAEYMRKSAKHDNEVTEPTTWNTDLYSIYKEFRDSLKENFSEAVEDIVEAIDESTIGKDQEEEEVESFIREQFERKKDVRIEKLNEELLQETDSYLKDVYLFGASKGAESLGVETSEIFDKHREQVLNEAVDKWSRPAYENTSDALSSEINDKVTEFFDTQDMGIHELKREIRGLAGTTDTSMDWRYERIARTETARLRNIGFMDEASKQGRELFDWITADDSRVCVICRGIEADNPHTESELAERTGGFVPHPNCRCAAGESESVLSLDEDDN